MPGPGDRVRIGTRNVMPGGSQLSSSGTTDENKTAEWRIHIQNVEVMYKRKWAFNRSTGEIDFTYLDANVTMEVSREHVYANASAGDIWQMHQLDLLSDATSGGIGSSGVIRTVTAGYIRREVRGGDVEYRQRHNTNIVTGRQPGQYNELYDTSATVGTNILDILIAAKAGCTEFEINLVDL